MELHDDLRIMPISNDTNIMPSVSGHKLTLGRSCQPSHVEVIDGIPSEILDIMLGSCDIPSLKAARCVSRRFNDCASRYCFRKMHLPGNQLHLMSLANHPIFRHFPQEIWLATNIWWDGFDPKPESDGDRAKRRNVLSPAKRREHSLSQNDFFEVYRKRSAESRPLLYNCQSSCKRSDSAAEHDFLTRLLELLPNIRKVVSCRARVAPSDSCDFTFPRRNSAEHSSNESWSMGRLFLTDRQAQRRIQSGTSTSRQTMLISSLYRAKNSNLKELVIQSATEFISHTNSLNFNFVKLSLPTLLANIHTLFLHFDGIPRFDRHAFPRNLIYLLHCAKQVTTLTLEFRLKRHRLSTPNDEYHEHPLDNIIPHLTFPKLENLNLTQWKCDIYIFTAFIARHASSLREVSFPNAHLERDEHPRFTPSREQLGTHRQILDKLAYPPQPKDGWEYANALLTPMLKLRSGSLGTSIQPME
ncbi:hypothetical protein DSL72_001434 [Monilinia vaccinii-corymbosi]|uniref:F-box domain-containing protein n=1 Tax=Monilinia vaccinii-corymbosi TaxID=61207 RepID=A0A8A3P1V1_9HELO|nr:hypothetical protein DSL72_001434 [Monilinia vaccinii-corymbosi]